MNKEGGTEEKGKNKRAEEKDFTCKIFEYLSVASTLFDFPFVSFCPARSLKTETLVFFLSLGLCSLFKKQSDPSVLLPHSRQAVKDHCRPPFLLFLITISSPSSPATPPSSQAKEEATTATITAASATWQQPFRRQFRPPQPSILDATTTKRTTLKSST